MPFSAMVRNTRTKWYTPSDGPTHQLYWEFCLKVYLKNWLRYRYSKFQFCLLPSAIDILATVTTLGTFKHLDISNFSCKFQRNRPSSLCDTVLLSLSSASAMSAQRGLLTHLCFRGTNIILTAKRSYSRTLRRLQTILSDFCNLLHVLLRPKKRLIRGTMAGTPHIRSPTFPARVTL